jgi:hypothetical protein
MPVLWFMEYDIPKDEEAKKKYLNFIFDEGYSCMVMEICEKIDAKLNVWVDDSGHIIFTIEFKTAQDYERLFNDPEWQEWQKGQSRLDQLVLNVKTRLMRPAGE